MAAPCSLEEIRAYWQQQAKAHGQSPAASWTDEPMIELEIRNISGYLADGDRVLDAGCANGYSTVQYAATHALHILGIDYIPEMITEARRRLEGMQRKLHGEVQFEIGDITAINKDDRTYDKVVVTRVIINLENRETQVQGLQECARVLKTGGTLLLSEATLQGWERLNRFRNEWGLPDIPMPPFNLYLDQDKMVEAVSSVLRLEQIVDFASTYYVGTRVLKPLVIQATGSQNDVADPNMEWNRWFSQLPPAGDYGTQKLFVFQKV